MAGGTQGASGISKAADMSMARALSFEWGPQNVRVHAIVPGLVRTDFARALWEDPERLERVNTRVPLRRIGEPEEIAGIAADLASPAGAYTTGTSLCGDGCPTAAT